MFKSISLCRCPIQMIVSAVNRIFIVFYGIVILCFVVDAQFHELMDANNGPRDNRMDLSKKNISEYWFHDLWANNITEVDLRGNPLHEIHFNETDYKRLIAKGPNITIWLDSKLDCRCKHGWLARALRDTPRLVINEARCDDIVMSRLAESPRERNECDDLVCYPGCFCRRQWRRNITTAYCTSLTTMPKVQGARAILAKDNSIQELSETDLPDDLLFLDISGNKIRQVNAEVTEQLFRIQKRRMWFGRNPLQCNCENYYFFTNLKNHSNQISDYETISCTNATNTNQLVKDLDLEELCIDEPLDRGGIPIVAVAASVVIIVIIMVAISLAYVYKSHIKYFLIAKGVHLWDTPEDEADEDRPYDVFLSFSHEDNELVLNEILPGLEGDKCNYKVCVHYRDWVPGDFIPAQIIRSVESSRRTIVLLSKHFVASVWAMMEFRTAHITTLNERRSRLIIVITDDVLETTDLDSELKSYLYSNTYLRWDDSSFWVKLRQAVPRTSRKSSTS